MTWAWSEAFHPIVDRALLRVNNMCNSFISCPCQHRYCPSVHWKWSQEPRWPVVVCCVSAWLSSYFWPGGARHRLQSPITAHPPSPCVTARDMSWLPWHWLLTLPRGEWSLHSWSWQYIRLFQNQDGHSLVKSLHGIIVWMNFPFSKKKWKFTYFQSMNNFDDTYWRLLSL